MYLRTAPAQSPCSSVTKATKRPRGRVYTTPASSLATQTVGKANPRTREIAPLSASHFPRPGAHQPDQGPRHILPMQRGGGPNNSRPCPCRRNRQRRTQSAAGHGEPPIAAIAAPMIDTTAIKAAAAYLVRQHQTATNGFSNSCSV